MMDQVYWWCPVLCWFFYLLGWFIFDMGYDFFCGIQCLLVGLGWSFGTAAWQIWQDMCGSSRLWYKRIRWQLKKFFFIRASSPNNIRPSLSFVLHFSCRVHLSSSSISRYAFGVHHLLCYLSLPSVASYPLHEHYSLCCPRLQVIFAAICHRFLCCWLT